jgi:hypothetical protein
VRLRRLMCGKAVPFRQVLPLFFEAAPHAIDCNLKHVAGVRRY